MSKRDARTAGHRLPLELLAQPLMLCRLPAAAPVPDWTGSARHFLSITRTGEELSIIADEMALPPDCDSQRGYRAIRVRGPLPLDLVGIFAALATPLADAGIPIFPIATYDTDYLLVQQADLAAAVEVLERAGHLVARGRNV